MEVGGVGWWEWGYEGRGEGGLCCTKNDTINVECQHIFHTSICFDML